MKTIYAALVLLLLTPTARAEPAPVGAEVLMRFCRTQSTEFPSDKKPHNKEWYEMTLLATQNAARAMSCVYYIRGFADAHANAASTPACVPNVTAGELRQQLLRYADLFPKKVTGQDAAALVRDMLNNVYPCAEERKS